MAVKSSISLTDQQDAFVRHLIEQGRYPSVSAALQHGVELLRLQTQGEEAEIAALRAVLETRRHGEFTSGVSMKDTIAAIADKKRRTHGV